jgi:gluconate 2-dehydrogenase gamma chain
MSTPIEHSDPEDQPGLSDQDTGMPAPLDNPAEFLGTSPGPDNPLTTPVSRGRLFRLTGTGIKAGIVAYAGARMIGRTDLAEAAAARAPAPAPVPPPQLETGTAAELHHQPLRCFNSAQAAMITAMAERIFPADKTGPGATDAHVVDYIDGQLAGDWGWGSRMYLRGPFFTPETSGHGWQVSMNPRDVYSDALAGLDAYTQLHQKNSFDQLDAKTQDTILKLLQAGNVPMSLPSDQFFSVFFENVKEGLFADPIYGGNFNFIGWKWVNFPGNPYAYGDPYATYIDKFNYPYNVAPKGLADQAY